MRLKKQNKTNYPPPPTKHINIDHRGLMALLKNSETYKTPLSDLLETLKIFFFLKILDVGQDLGLSLWAAKSPAREKQSQ